MNKFKLTAISLGLIVVLTGCGKSDYETLASTIEGYDFQNTGLSLTANDTYEDDTTDVTMQVDPANKMFAYTVTDVYGDDGDTYTQEMYTDGTTAYVSDGEDYYQFALPKVDLGKLQDGFTKKTTIKLPEGDTVLTADQLDAVQYGGELEEDLAEDTTWNDVITTREDGQYTVIGMENILGIEADADHLALSAKDDNSSESLSVAKLTDKITIPDAALKGEK